MTGVEILLGAGLLLSLGLNAYSLSGITRVEERLRRTRRARFEDAAPNQAALQRVGLVRFNAYDDTGGEYSFALALLDSAANGVVISGLYHRERCRVYAKPVVGGASRYVLTDEEAAAIERAQAGPVLEAVGAGPAAG